MGVIVTVTAWNPTSQSIIRAKEDSNRIASAVTSSKHPRIRLHMSRADQAQWPCISGSGAGASLGSCDFIPHRMRSWYVTE